MHEFLFRGKFCLPPPQNPPRRGFKKNVSPQKLNKIETYGFH